ncbi:hypothetical protein COLO4_16028 [Corchorus olitorius]|uniref:Uncharacterized protein n=1 Tax=Corchorus olitorius TaxID=93759 RepID=A0A1R3JKA3_9ROSI|nr:hypothetical protein COLO4_16028 [Corchorus olitorius]
MMIKSSTALLVALSAEAPDLQMEFDGYCLHNRHFDEQ